jgi:hypothetical protein
VATHLGVKDLARSRIDAAEPRQHVLLRSRRWTDLDDRTEGRGRTQVASESRIDEAVALGAIENFVVACPKDVAMYDEPSSSGHEGEITLREPSELVIEATMPS